MQSKCIKCDERGYIQEDKYSSRSCECGWAIEQQKKVFENVSLEDLLSYAQTRIQDKQEGRSLIGNLLGSIKSEKKAESSRENGKKGGRPKGVDKSA